MQNKLFGIENKATDHTQQFKQPACKKAMEIVS